MRSLAFIPSLLERKTSSVRNSVFTETIIYHLLLMQDITKFRDYNLNDVVT